nr:putative ribonuclease H-like domain-containing protein [Tanacetum cinerariifolium]
MIENDKVVKSDKNMMKKNQKISDEKVGVEKSTGRLGRGGLVLAGKSGTGNKARLVVQGHTHEEGIDYEEVFAPVARIKALRLFLSYASFMGFMVYQMDVKSAFLYGTIEKEVYACQPLGFEDPDHPDKVYKVVKALYEGKSASTLIDTEKPLLKDRDGEDVDVHTYSSMIGSLMYLTFSRPDIMFAQIVVATSFTEAEYVEAASCCAQVLWI